MATPSGFARARTALASIEEKLRRQFGLVGEVGATIEPVIRPVVIAGDLREAGNSPDKGRAFAFHFSGGTAVGTDRFSIRPEQDVRVDSMIVGATAAATWDFAIFPPGTLGSAVSVLGGTWTDRKLILGDQVPLTVSPAFNGIISGIGITNSIAGGQIQANTSLVVPLNLMVPAQGCLTWVFPTGITAHISIAGRLWP